MIASLLVAGCARPGDEPPNDPVTTTPSSSPPPTSTGTPGSVTPSQDKVQDAPGPGSSATPGLSFVSSKDGLLQVKLVLANGTAVINGTSYGTSLYNGQLITPIWRLQRGDVLMVELEDERYVPPQDAGLHDHGDDHGTFFNYTNIHFHGLNVPPTPPGDSVFISVNPAASGFTPTSYMYEILIPEDHPEGLFWWHAHPHNVSNMQVAGGMSGAMIIGNVTQSHYPHVAYTKEQVVLLRDFSANETEASFQNNVPLSTINGVAQASFQIAPNEVQFWRFANIGANRDFKVALEDPDGRPVAFHVIAVDGNVRRQVENRENLFLHPGARMEAFVVGPAAGNYTLKTLQVAKNLKNVFEDEQVLGTLVSAPGVQPYAPPQGLSTAVAQNMDPRLGELERWMSNGNATVWRNVTFTAHNGGQDFGINGTKYDVNRTDTFVKYDTVEVWNILNPTNASHVFHIHQLDYLVYLVNGTKAGSGGLQDTVLVPPKGSVQLVIPFNTPNVIGRYVYHCHYLAHEDRGMMANILVQ